MIEFAFSIFKNRLARLWPIVLHLQYSWLYGNIWKFVGLQLKWCHISDKQHNVERLAACNPDWQELSNGRLAMLAFSGMVHHNLVPGTSITCGVYRSWNTIMGTNIWSCTSKGQTKMWTYHEVEVSPKISPKISEQVVKGPLFPLFPEGWEGPQGAWDFLQTFLQQAVWPVWPVWCLEALGILIALLELSTVVAWVFKTYDSEMMDPEGKKQVKIAGLWGKS